MDEEKKIFSKSPTIGVIEARKLLEITKTMWGMLSIDEYTKIMLVFGDAAERILKENGEF